jgi:hypothetical protein
MAVSTDDIREVYLAFRKAQAFHKGRGYRMPKDFEAHFEKMAEVHKRALIKATQWFITKWNNIDPYTYFLCGFELYKSFSYHNFFKQNIIKLYIEKDKNKKRKVETTKKGLAKSALFVKKWMVENDKNFHQYMRARDGNQRVAIDHYLKNNIDAAFLVFMIRRGMVLTDQDRSYIPYIQERYRKINFNLNDIEDFLIKVEEKLR